MSKSMFPGGDPLRRYWWAVLLLILLIGAWISYPLMGDRWQGMQAAGRGAAVNDQSLDGLDGVANVAGAPGAPLKLPMEGQGRYSRPSSGGDGPEGASAAARLAPDGAAASAGAPTASAGAQAAGKVSGGAGDSLAAALKKLAGGAKGGAGPAPSGHAPATGTPDHSSSPGGAGAAPRANFGTLGGLGAGGGTSARQDAAAAVPFGLGKVNAHFVAAGGGGDSGSPPSAPVGHLGTNQSLNALRGAQVQGYAAAASGGELAAGLGAKGFDGSKLLMGPRGGMNDSGGGVRVGGGGTVADLKANPETTKEVLAGPAPPHVDTKADQKQQMLQMVEMMLLQVAIGGLLGPVMGGLSGAMMGGMGMAAGPGMYGGGYGGYPGGAGMNPGMNANYFARQ